MVEIAWTDPRTWVAAETVTAALLNTHLRDNLIAIAEWTTYTPTLTQSGTVTKTVTYAKYKTYGGTTDLIVYLTVTGSGTGNNTITVSLPTTSATGTALIIGSGLVIDSGTALYPCYVEIASTTTVKFGRVDVSNTAGIGVDPNFALANNDQVRFFCSYENT